MASRGTAFFDRSGLYFKSANEATVSDLAAILGRVGEGDSLAPGIAKMLLQKRADIERVFADHDTMIGTEPELRDQANDVRISVLDNVDDKVAHIKRVA